MEGTMGLLLLVMSILTVVNIAVSIGITHNMRWFERLRAEIRQRVIDGGG